MLGTMRWALQVAACAGTIMMAGCGDLIPDNQSDVFVPGADDLGTLNGSAGRFDLRTSEDGVIEEIVANTLSTGNTGRFTLPTSDSGTMTITSDTGGEVRIVFGEITTIELRDGAFERTFEIDTTRIEGFDLDAFMQRTGQQRAGGCVGVVTQVDAACRLLNPFELEEVEELIVSGLAASGNSFPGDRVLVSELLHKYFDMIVTFCDEWGKYRDNGGEPCTTR